MGLIYGEGESCMNLADKVSEKWERNEERIRTNLAKWAFCLKEQQKILEAKKKFHQWEPLRAYLSTTKVKGGLFSLRFWGQEVGELVLKDGKIILKIKAGTAVCNKRFGLKPVDWTFNENEAASWEWKGKKAGIFRKYFQEYERRNAKKYTEHFVESELIREMSRSTRKKFGGKLHHIQPVRIAGFPLQLPVPISACTGEPNYSPKGNIDILARRKGGRLSVWELKKPNGDLRKVLQQAYIYAVVLLKMIRQPQGNEWYEIMVPNACKGIPPSLTVESVVVIEKSKEEYLKERYEKLKEDMPTHIGRDRIEFYAVHYDAKTLQIDGLNRLDRP